MVQVRASLQALAPPLSSPALPVCSQGFTLLHLPLLATQVTSEHTTILRLEDFSEDHTSLRITSPGVPGKHSPVQKHRKWRSEPCRTRSPCYLGDFGHTANLRYAFLKHQLIHMNNQGMPKSTDPATHSLEQLSSTKLFLFNS